MKGYGLSMEVSGHSLLRVKELPAADGPCPPSPTGPRYTKKRFRAEGA